MAEIQIEVSRNPMGIGGKSVVRFEGEELIPGRVYRLPTGEPSLLDANGWYKVWSPREIELYPDAFTGNVCGMLADLDDETLSGVVRSFGGDPFLLPLRIRRDR